MKRVSSTLSDGRTWESISSIWSQYDFYGTGTLDIEDFTSMARSLLLENFTSDESNEHKPEDFNEADYASIFAQIDEDGTGEITKNDFYLYIKRQGTNL